MFASDKMWNKKTQMCNRRQKYHHVKVCLPEKIYISMQIRCCY